MSTDDLPATAAWTNREWSGNPDVNVLVKSADAMRDELLERIGNLSQDLDMANGEVARCHAALAEARAQLDAVFHEFTDEMEDDAWQATLEWLRRDHPDLARRYDEAGTELTFEAMNAEEAHGE